LAGGPPSTDLEYVLPGAKSAVTFALPFDQQKIEDYLAKRDRDSHQRDYNQTSTMSSGVAAQMAGFFRQLGFEAVGVLNNEVYRNEDGIRETWLYPDLSHRYLAVRGGIGSFGFSGNILTPSYGASVALATMVTNAELEPSDPLPEEESYCDDCQACSVSCAPGFFKYGKKDKETVTMGGIEFAYSKRRSYHRCPYVCTGYTGLAPSGQWSTWSPGRFPIPKNDEDMKPALVEAINAWQKRPDLHGDALQQPLIYKLMGKSVALTCGHCMLVCSPDADERKRRLELIKTSGVVIQMEDGSLDVVTPDAARQHMDSLPPETRALYEPVDSQAFEGVELLGAKNRST